MGLFGNNKDKPPKPPKPGDHVYGMSEGEKAGMAAQSTAFNSQSPSSGFTPPDIGKMNSKMIAREMLAADTATLNSDPNKLGLTEAQRETIMGQVSANANAKAQAQASILGRDALAGQGFQAGAFQQAGQDLTKAGDNAAAAASGDVNKLHQGMVQAEKDRILGNVEAAAARRRENEMFWARLGVNVAGAVLTITTGGAGLLAVSAANAAMSSMPKAPAGTTTEQAPPQATLLPQS